MTLMMMIIYVFRICEKIIEAEIDENFDAGTTDVAYVFCIVVFLFIKFIYN